MIWELGKLRNYKNPTLAGVITNNKKQLAGGEDRQRAQYSGPYEFLCQMFGYLYPKYRGKSLKISNSNFKMSPCLPKESLDIVMGEEKV